MSREEKSLCPACGKKKSRMAAHFAISHPDLDPNVYGIGTFAPSVAYAGPGVDPGDFGLDPPQPEAEDSRPADPLGDPAVGQAISSLLRHIEEQRAMVAGQQEQIQNLTAELSGFQASVLKNFNEMPKLVQGSVTAHFDQLIAEAQARAAGNGAQPAAVAPEDPPPTAMMAPAGAGPGRNAMLEQLLPVFLQAIAGGNKPAGGDLMQQITMLKTIADAFNPMPNILAGMNMATTMFTAASRSGISPQDAAKGSEHLIETMQPLTQPKWPPAAPGQTG